MTIDDTMMLLYVTTMINMMVMVIISHICHFFHTGRIFENQILHPKKRLKAPKTLKTSLKKSNICIFSLNLEKFTPDIYTGTACGACDKYEAWTYAIERIQ